MKLLLLPLAAPFHLEKKSFNLEKKSKKTGASTGIKEMRVLLIGNDDV